MKHAIIYGVLFFVVIVAVAASDRDLIRACRDDCRETKNAANLVCREDYSACREQCVVDSEACTSAHAADRDVCVAECGAQFNPDDPSLDRKESRSVARDLRACKRVCDRTFRTDSRGCSVSQCRRECSGEKRHCTTEVNDVYRSCTRNCIYTAFNDNITCDNGMAAGTKFLDGCDSCECGFDGKVYCEASATCHFDNLTVSGESCISAGGLYQRLCKGPYFRLRCSRDYFCQCDGDDEYTCPANHACVHDFTPPRIPPSLEGFRDTSGQELGDIGVCASFGKLDNCGNGVCENVVCSTCPDPETVFTCPEDCA